MDHSARGREDAAKEAASTQFIDDFGGISYKQYVFERNQKKLRHLVRNFNHPVYRNFRLQAAGFKPFSQHQSKLIWQIAHERGWKVPE